MDIINVTPQDNLRKILGSLSSPTTIYLEEGVYRVKAEIAQSGVTLIGKNRETTVIVYDDYARKMHTDGREYNTFRTYTLCVCGDDVKLKNLTVENSNKRPEEVGQCVALSVNGKNFSAENCCFRSTQDTLFLAPFPDDLVTRYRGFIPRGQLYMEGGAVSAFKNCEICGSVDFIFGGGEGYFLNCTLVSVQDARGKGYVAAPCHPLECARGFVFFNCEFAGGGAEKGSVYLARPWRDYGKCEFLNCRLGGHIAPALFDPWNDTRRDLTARFCYANLYGAEIKPASWGVQLAADGAESLAERCGEIEKIFFG